MGENNLPWTKSQIVEAVCAGTKPEPLDTISINRRPVVINAFCQLALGRPEGRASPLSEGRLMRRLSRVYCAIEQGHDPEAAYDIPLPNEEPPPRTRLLANEL